MMRVVQTLFVLSFLFAGCSKPLAEEYIKKASEAEKAGLWTVALEHYQQLLKDRSGDPLAETAMFNIAAIQHNNLQNFQAAVDGYKLFIEKYPGGAKAPTALFLAAFLYNNELKNLDSAKACYERFLSRYPQHEMAASAQFELQNLGKSADEILPKPTVVETTPPKSELAKSDKKAPIKPKKN